MSDFIAGRLTQFEDAWSELTSDPQILSMIAGVKVEFDCPLEQLAKLSSTKSIATSAKECEVIDLEIKKLLSKQVISPCEHCQGEVISPVFTRPKKDGSHRMILNLKRLNSEVSYHHFKMDTLYTALTLITKNCLMASIDLKDAYYSVAIHEEHRKLLRFQWKGQIYEFNALPNGLSSAPRLFTKLLKPVYASLRLKGHISTGFLDDSLLIGHTMDDCMRNVSDTTELFQNLGFIIHPNKSVLHPTTKIQYLGVIIDSASMKVTLSAERAHSIKCACQKLVSEQNHTIREVAQVIGKIVASFAAVKYGPLHYRQLEKDKKLALKRTRGDFDELMQLSEGSIEELKWWIVNVIDAENDICGSEPDLTISTDASTTGWGCECLGTASGGQWLPHERVFHINYLELKAVLFALQCFQEQLEHKHVRVLIDNTTAVCCINRMGTSHSDACNDITFTIWSWCLAHNIWISAAHIPGKQNITADKESRRQNIDAEWKLDESALQTALRQLGASPVIDLFASRLNCQMQRYISYRPDPEAEAVDAFSVSWEHLQFYAFPPFSIIGRVLQKIQRDQAQGIVVVPNWPTQPWFAVLQHLLCQPPVELKCRQRLLHLPSDSSAVHPLIQRRRLNLLVCKISAKNF